MIEVPGECFIQTPMASAIYLQEILFLVLAVLCSMWDLGSPSRDRVRARCNGSAVLTAELPEQFQEILSHLL